MPVRSASTWRAKRARSSANGSIACWPTSTAWRRRQTDWAQDANGADLHGAALRAPRRVAIRSAARAALLDEGAQPLLRRVRHGDVDEILDRGRDAAAVVEIVLAHEGRAAQPHD